jgi:hypothetical protein
MTEIDGSKTPELIPDHVVWRMTFNRLAEIRRRGEEADLADLLPLSKADLAIVYLEATKQRARDESCRERYQAKQQELRETPASPDATMIALDDLIIDCRTRDLDASDRVMDALSEEGRQILSAYTERCRRSTSSVVPNRELKTFRLPR